MNNNVDESDIPKKVFTDEEIMNSYPPTKEQFLNAFRDVEKLEKIVTIINSPEYILPRLRSQLNIIMGGGNVESYVEAIE